MKNKLPCVTCVKHGRCHRTVGKSGDRYICGDYSPVRCCENCRHDGYQLVERKCIGCNVEPVGEFKNFEVRT